MKVANATGVNRDDHSVYVRVSSGGCWSHTGVELDMRGDCTDFDLSPAVAGLAALPAPTPPALTALAPIRVDELGVEVVGVGLVGVGPPDLDRTPPLVDVVVGGGAVRVTPVLGLGLVVRGRRVEGVFLLASAPPVVVGLD